jgi:hypothetical protein
MMLWDGGSLTMFFRWLTVLLSRRPVLWPADIQYYSNIPDENGEATVENYIVDNVCFFSVVASDFHISQWFTFVIGCSQYFGE